MKDNLIKWFLALLFDKLKVGNPTVLMVIAIIAVGVQASILYALQTGAINDNSALEFLLQLLATLIPAGTAVIGTRTTRYIKQAKQFHRNQYLQHVVASAELQPFSFVQQVGQLGIERTKAILTVFVGTTLMLREFILDFRDTSLFDKGRSLVELFFLVQKSLPDLLMAKAAWQELKDMDAVEAVAIENHLKAIYDDADDELEAIVEDGFELIPHVHNAGMEIAEGVTASVGVAKKIGNYVDILKARRAV